MVRNNKMINNIIFCQTMQIALYERLITNSKTKIYLTLYNKGDLAYQRSMRQSRSKSKK